MSDLNVYTHDLYRFEYFPSSCFHEELSKSHADQTFAITCSFDAMSLLDGETPKSIFVQNFRNTSEVLTGMTQNLN